VIVRTSSGDPHTAHVNLFSPRSSWGRKKVTGTPQVAPVVKRGVPASLIRSLLQCGKSHHAGDRPFSVYLALKHLTEGYESWKFTRRAIGLLKVGQTPSPKPFDTIRLVPESSAAIGKTLAKVPIFSGLEENELSFLAQRTVLRIILRARACLAKVSLALGSTSSKPATYESLRVRPMGANKY